VGYESGHALSRVTLRPDGPSSSPTSRERIKPGISPTGRSPAGVAAPTTPGEGIRVGVDGEHHDAGQALVNPPPGEVERCRAPRSSAEGLPDGAGYLRWAVPPPRTQKPSRSKPLAKPSFRTGAGRFGGEAGMVCPWTERCGRGFPQPGGCAGSDTPMFFFFSNKLGCFGSILVSVALSAVLYFLFMR